MPHSLLRTLVLAAPLACLSHGGGDDGNVVAFVWAGVLPDKAGFAVVVHDVGGEPIRDRRLDAGLLQYLADDGGAVGFVFAEGLAGPVPGDQGATAANTKAFAIMRFGHTVTRVQPWRGLLRLDAVAQPVGASW